MVLMPIILGMQKIKMPGGGLPGILNNSLWGVSTMNRGAKLK